MAEILKGIDVVRALSEKLAAETVELKAEGVTPCICVIRAGSRADDIAYENGIVKRCEKIGIAVRQISLAQEISTGEVVAEIKKANADSAIHGVLIMRPLPKQVDDRAVCAALDSQKDVDGITDVSMADVYAGRGGAFVPCTAEACIELLDYYNIDVTGKDVAIIGRSLVIGKPVAMMLIKRSATVTICHTRTADIRGICRRADIIIAAAGAAKMIGAEYVTQGQIVVDVGINADADGNLCGDVDFGPVSEIAGAITPVPGGVGTVTSAVLAQHVVQAAKLEVRS